MDKMILLGLYWILRILSPAMGLYFCSAGYDMFYFSFYQSVCCMYSFTYGTGCSKEFGFKKRDFSECSNYTNLWALST